MKRRYNIIISLLGVSDLSLKLESRAAGLYMACRWRTMCRITVLTCTCALLSAPVLPHRGFFNCLVFRLVQIHFILNFVYCQQKIFEFSETICYSREKDRERNIG